MSLRISVVPASTKAGHATLSVLLNHKASPKIHAIYRDLSKVPPEFTNHYNFVATQGDIASSASLDFSGSDAVFYIPPPTQDGSDPGETASQNANNVKEALKRAQSVKRLVLFSSMGSQYDHGIGILQINHISDQILKDSAQEVVIPRPGYFQENWAHAFETMQADPPVFYSPMSPADHKIPMVSLADIGSTCAQALLETGSSLPSNPHFFDLYGPRNYSTLDVKSAIEQVTGKPVEAVVIPKAQLADFYSQTVPSGSVQEMVEMTEAALPGGIMASDFENDENTVRGGMELVDALRKMYQP